MPNNLRKLRRERGLTQLALQTKTGIEQALLSKYETGQRVPPTETLILLADFYGVSIDYLLDDSNIMAFIRMTAVMGDDLGDIID